ncbi:RNA polymerase sigma-70 factor (ECF subfamily) [Mycetocola sp. BIGb0189]|uniref:RNA polymerase sigma factor n=1 Tax=Mycetocola sp. BIGb0189 TaxID=2940604 RepID=UPI0021691B2B|nr:sigma-70 family RNA polymerase sigma factor [Mycetocola sp. BIGb0189]MCS4276496.1 RNA polymerase sigma-70 factor (ECF subfamily) [Mycetocola sp. BIGb0189]
MSEFSEFFRANHSLVVGVAERRLSSRQDGEEIATEAFRIAWERHCTGEPLSVPWLYGVVRNLIGNEYRRRERQENLHTHLGEKLSARPQGDDDTHADIRDALERLPHIHRDVLMMTYWEDLTTREIADILSTTPLAIRTRLVRARRLLRTALADLDHNATTEVSTHE